MAAIDKVKIIVVGDSGVGKTSLTHLICRQRPISNPSWTIGCSVEVKLHEYKEGTPNQKSYFIELWDVGGSRNHLNTRTVFYHPTNGIILVHDLTNRKSQQNLQKWLQEVLSKDGNGGGGGGSVKSKSFDDFDPEKFVGSTQIPILVVGTKSDLVAQVRTTGSLQRRSSTIAEECGADEIFLDSRQTRSLAAGTTSSLKLSRFFDKVIERRYYAVREAAAVVAATAAAAAAAAATASASTSAAAAAAAATAISLDKRRLPMYNSVYGGPNKIQHND